jgi:flavodoxin
MKCAVLYFTRTGNSKRVAEKIASEIGVKAIEITDNKNWNGVIGYIKAGFYASANKNVDIKVNDEYKNADQYVVISPVWAGKPTPAIMSFLKLVDSNKVNLVLDCMGSDVNTSFTNYENKFGKLKGKFGIIKKQNDEDKVISEIITIAKS